MQESSKTSANQISLVPWHVQESEAQCLPLRSKYEFQAEFMPGEQAQAGIVILSFLAEINALKNVINNGLERGTIRRAP